MDDTAQYKNASDDQHYSQSAQSQQTQQQDDSQQPHHSPVGVSNKEHAPVSSHQARPEAAPHEATPTIPKEVSAHMEVAKNHEEPQLSEEHRKMGFRNAHEQVAPPIPVPVDDTSLPLTPAQVTQSQTKQYSIWDSFKWYGGTVGRQMLRKIFLGQKGKDNV